MNSQANWLEQQEVADALQKYGQMCREYQTREATDFPMNMEQICAPQRALISAVRTALVGTPDHQIVDRLQELDSAMTVYDSNVHSRKGILDALMERSKKSPEPTPAEKISFPKGKRLSNTQALSLLEQASGLSRSDLLNHIPELRDDNLAFGLLWVSDGFNDSEAGKFNAAAVHSFIELHVPVMNVAGDKRNDVENLNRSYHINVETHEIRGFKGFYDAENDLGETHATARVDTAFVPRVI